LKSHDRATYWKHKRHVTVHPVTPHIQTERSHGSSFFLKLYVGIFNVYTVVYYLYSTSLYKIQRNGSFSALQRKKTTTNCPVILYTPRVKQNRTPYSCP